MAIRKISLLKSALAAVVIATAWHVPAHADLATDVYHLTICGGFTPPRPNSRCFVRNQGGPPPGNAIHSLNAASFDEYFTNWLGVPQGLDYSFTIEGGSKSGFLYGSVTHETTDDFSAFDGEFFSLRGTVLQVELNAEAEGLQITSINDNGIVIGYNGQIAFSSDVFDMPLHETLWNLDDPSFDIIRSAGVGLTDFEDATFLALDDRNRISGISSLGAFLLTPADLLPVPEPSSLDLLAGALGMLLLRKRDP
jgi:hypothetical protein